MAALGRPLGQHRVRLGPHRAVLEGEVATLARPLLGLRLGLVVLVELVVLVGVELGIAEQHDRDHVGLGRRDRLGQLDDHAGPLADLSLADFELGGTKVATLARHPPARPIDLHRDVVEN